MLLFSKQSSLYLVVEGIFRSGNFKLVFRLWYFDWKYTWPSSNIWFTIYILKPKDFSEASEGPTWICTVLFTYILYLSFQVFMGLLSVWTSGSLICLPSLGAFSFCLVPSSTLKWCFFVLSFYTSFCCVIS